MQTDSVRRRALLIINENSRTGGDVDPRTFVNVLTSAGIDTETASLSDGNTFERLLQSRQQRPDIVVIAGGDGTVHGAIPALLQCDRPFSLLPSGTANDLARGLGIPTDVAGAAAVVINGVTARIDVAKANGQFFLNVAGIGLGPAMTRNMEDGEKARWGVLSYLMALLRTVRKHKSFKATITCDGVPMRVRAVQINVANGKYYGGGMIATDTTLQDDGKLDLVVVKAVGFLQLLRLGPRLRRGKIALQPEVVVRQAKHIHVATRKPRSVTSDGEPTTQTPVSFSVHEESLQVFVSPDADAVLPDIAEAS